MSSIQLCAAHQATSGFDGDAIAQYMRTDFITLQEHLSVHEAREHFISQLASDDIPGQVFVVAGKKLRGSLSVKKLLQETDINQSIRHLMDSCLFRVKPDDERQQVIAELSERGLDLVGIDPRQRDQDQDLLLGLDHVHRRFPARLAAARAGVQIEEALVQPFGAGERLDRIRQHPVGLVLGPHRHSPRRIGGQRYRSCRRP